MRIEELFPNREGSVDLLKKGTALLGLVSKAETMCYDRTLKWVKSWRNSEIVDSRSVNC